MTTLNSKTASLKNYLDDYLKPLNDLVVFVKLPVNNVGDSFRIPNTNHILTFSESLTIPTHPDYLIHDANVKKYAKIFSDKILEYVTADSENSIVYFSSPDLTIFPGIENESFTTNNLNFRYLESANMKGDIIARIDVIFGKTVVGINVSTDMTTKLPKGYYTANEAPFFYTQAQIDEMEGK